MINRPSAIRLLSPTPLNTGAWSLGAGIRSAIAVCIPLVLAEWLDQSGLSWAAIVALWICLVDPGGPTLVRVRLLGWFSVFSVISCVLGALLRPHLWLSAVIALLWCTATCLIRVWGTNAANAGTLLAINFLIVLGLAQAADLHAALIFGGWSAAGAIWALLIVLVLWRQRPYAPARAAMAAVFEALGTYAGALPALRAGGADAPSGPLRAACRNALEAARSVLITMQRDRSGQSVRGQHLVLMLADAERCFAVLLAIDELLAHAEHGPVPNAALTGIGSGLSGIAVALRTRSLAAHLPDLPRNPEGEIGRLLARAAQWMSAAAEHMGGITPDTPPPPSLTPPANPGLLAPLRDHLSFNSLAFRHSARLAVTGTVLVLLTNGLDIERGYWLTLTAVAVLQVYPSATWTRALERTGGSVMGGLIAAAAAFLLHGPAQATLIILPLCLITMSVRGVSYALFVLFLTPTIVLMAELFQTGAGLSPHLAELRAIDTAVGSAIGLIASFVLWPSWEARYLRPRLAENIRANGAFFLAALRLRDHPDTLDDVEAKRRAAGLASNNADASLQRIMSEPRRNQQRIVGAAMVITAAARRLAGVAAAVMQIAPDLNADLGPAGAAFGQEIDALVAAVSGGPAPPDAPDPPDIAGLGPLLGPEIERGWRQLELIREAARRLAADREQD